MSSFFFFNDTATTEIYTLSLHDALPICPRDLERAGAAVGGAQIRQSRSSEWTDPGPGDRSEEHTSELQSPDHLVCRLLLEKKKKVHNYEATRPDRCVGGSLLARDITPDV